MRNRIKEFFKRLVTLVYSIRAVIGKIIGPLKPVLKKSFSLILAVIGWITGPLKPVLKKSFSLIRAVIVRIVEPVKPILKRILERLSSFIARNERVARIFSSIGEILKPILKGGARNTLFYIAVFLVALFFFVIVNFDTNVLIVRLENLIAQETGAEVTIGELKLAFPYALKFRNMKIKKESSGLEIEIDYLKARLLLTSLFSDYLKMRFYTESGKGNLQVDFKGKLKKGENAEIAISSNKFPIHKLLKKYNDRPFPINALVDSKGVFDIADGFLPGVTGRIELSISKINFKDRIIGEGLVEKLVPQKASCTITIDKRRFRTRDCKAETPVGNLELRITTGLANRIEKTRIVGVIVISNPSGFLKSLLSVYPKFRRPDGSYHISLRGTFAQPGFRL